MPIVPLETRISKGKNSDQKDTWVVSVAPADDPDKPITLISFPTDYEADLAQKQIENIFIYLGGEQK
jgi:hypothetical protein